MSFIFRAYHAMQRSRPMSTRTGVPTAATYVFINMLNKLREDFSPRFIAAVFDVSAPLFRDERARTLTTVKKFNIKTQTFDEVDYGGYKANRTAMPPDLAQQVPYIRRALEAFHIPILFSEGYEADDVIGTLAHKAEQAGYDAFVVSSDKDMMQLVTEHVRILNPAKDNLILDPAGVERVLGVQPSRVIDVMALRGDSIDNIPGAPGIGDKGSVELIKQFGSVEAALDRAAEVARKTYRESLENNREAVLLSKELVTIECNLPMELDVEAMRMGEPDTEAQRALYAELEFTTLLKNLAQPVAPPVDSTPIEYVTTPDTSQITALANAAREYGLSIAVEGGRSAPTTAADDEEPAPGETATAMAFDFSAPAEQAATPAKRQFFAGVAAAPGQVLRLDLLSADAEPLRAALATPQVVKRVYDLKAVLRRLDDAELRLAGEVEDLMLYSYLVNPTHASHTLVDIVARSGAGAMQEAGERSVMEAAGEVMRLVPVMKAQAEQQQLGEVYREIDLPLVPVLLRMERVGCRVDLKVLADLSRRITADMQTTGEEIFEKSGNRFNINSPKQLGDVLFNKMGLPKPIKYGKGKVISTAQDVLEDLAAHSEVPRLVLEYRYLAKLKSNYVDALPLLVDHEQRVHTTFNQVGTATGRLSSTNPNLQNIPVRTALGREIRTAFIAAPGNKLLSADYSQIELRLMAHFSQDPLLLRAYREGGDIHTLTAAEVFEVAADEMDKQTRDRAKAINFGIVYGISPFGLAQQNIGIDQHQARLYIDRYFERYAGVRTFIDQTLEECRRQQSVRTLHGRVRPIPDILSSNANTRGFAERTAVNTPLQGTAADLIKIAMIRLDAELARRKLRTQMTLQIHDELLFDVPEDEVEIVKPLVKEVMESVVELSIPLVADVGVGDNWRDME